jgi:hypothetical protein
MAEIAYRIPLQVARPTPGRQRPDFWQQGARLKGARQQNQLRDLALTEKRRQLEEQERIRELYRQYSARGGEAIGQSGGNIPVGDDVQSLGQLPGENMALGTLGQPGVNAPRGGNFLRELAGISPPLYEEIRTKRKQESRVERQAEQDYKAGILSLKKGEIGLRIATLKEAREISKYIYQQMSLATDQASYDRTKEGLRRYLASKGLPTDQIDNTPVIYDAEWLEEAKKGNLDLNQELDYELQQAELERRQTADRQRQRERTEDIEREERHRQELTAAQKAQMAQRQLHHEERQAGKRISVEEAAERITALSELERKIERGLAVDKDESFFQFMDRLTVQSIKKDAKTASDPKTSPDLAEAAKRRSIAAIRAEIQLYMRYMPPGYQQQLQESPSARVAPQAEPLRTYSQEELGELGTRLGVRGGRRAR